LMQVGAFSDRDNAEDAVRLLNQSGLRAVIQRL
ncbi:SPOR domain-containing protein, partial [Leptolyngbya sp. FACHB-711]|nr:SPOR domain-containing protein [Leptolyngbya sp. FACHB-711]